MDAVTTLFGVVAILSAILLLIAEPKRFIPEIEKKARKVGLTYWGFYEGAEQDDTEALRTVEWKDVARKQQYVAGSITYSQGRGVNMSGRSKRERIQTYNKRSYHIQSGFKWKLNCSRVRNFNRSLSSARTPCAHSR